MILVAGGSGRLGREVVAGLLARGQRVSVLSRNRTAARSNLPAEVELVAGDVTAPLDRACEGVDVVVSAVTGFGPGGAGTRRVDESGNANLIRTAEAAGVRRFVLVSMHGAAPDHPMELMRRKFAAEQVLRATALDWRIVRPTVFAELWAEIIGRPVVGGRPATVFGRGDNPINFVAVTDVAAAVVSAALEPELSRRTIPVGGPENVRLNDLVGLVGDVAGRQPRVRHVPVPALRALTALTRPVRPDIAGLLEAAVAMSREDMTLDPRDARALLPGLPSTALRTVVESAFSAEPSEAMEQHHEEKEVRSARLPPRLERSIERDLLK